MNKKGQNIIEYLLMVTTVCVVVIAFLGPAGPFGASLDRSLDLTMVNYLTKVSQNVTINSDIP